MKKMITLAGLLVIALASSQCLTVNYGTRNANETASNTAAPAPAGSATASAEALTAEEIVDRYARFLGGEAAARAVTSWSAKGTFEMPEVIATGSVESYAKVPNKTAAVFKTSDNRPFAIQAFDGASGWEQTLRKDEGRILVRNITGAELDLLKLNSDFYREYRLKTLYPHMLLKGKGQVDKREAYVIEATPVSGKTETLYFDPRSGELIRRDLTLAPPQGEMAAQIYYDDYRGVSGASGVKMPYTHSLIFPDHPDGNVIVRFTEIQANVPLLDKTFERREK